MLKYIFVACKFEKDQINSNQEIVDTFIWSTQWAVNSVVRSLIWWKFKVAQAFMRVLITWKY